MPRRTPFALLAFCLTLSPVFCQEADDAPAAPDAAAMMEAWQKTAVPGEEHGRLEHFVGEWDVTGTFWTDPAAPPTKSTGTNVGESLLGGRWIREAYRGEFMGQPFHGIGELGYDNVAKKYVSVWRDDMSTGLMTERGTYDAEKKQYVFRGVSKDPFGEPLYTRSVVKIDGPDRHTVTAWHGSSKDVMPKAMELVYTRKK